MKLSKLALLAIKGGGKDMKYKLAKALGVRVDSVYKYIQNNDDMLTKAAALKLIREETGLTDQEILEDETEPVKNRA